VEANTVGYIGNMGDRVDWRFVHETASILPDVRFVFVGRLDEKIKPKKMLEWHALRDKVFCLKNVESLGHVPYEKLAHFYQSFAVNWMPYDTTKPFNIASCPTKIFDALAAGRPFLSTDLPECRMYSEYIRIVTCPSEAREAILSSLLNWNFALEARQIGFAKRNDWHARATLLDQLLLS
jgi:glycosyltransferase involved in cell wall biosynthesis